MTYMSDLQQSNPSYSMRAFAKKCSVHPAVISEIFSGKRKVSTSYAKKILENLMIDPIKQEQLITCFDDKSSSEDIKFKQLRADQYFVVADPIYYSLLSLFDTRKPPEQPDEIAKRLGVSTWRVEQAIERLIRLGFIKKHKSSYKNVSEPLTTTEDIANSSLKKRHENNLRAALESLYSDPVDERDFSFITMAIDPDKIPKAKKMIRKFKRELAKELESGNQAEVYELSIQLFPRSKKGELT